ncbi:PhzF family phenazine biosynthesis protein [Marinactinospora rubrisoli]|uniref:PhzF family phenazine biosynthesis protein n=1 Tax=Marinactinospora rubrisoli TaxID=2715399 RepID=A0ABW2KA57_9ACTN
MPSFRVVDAFTDRPFAGNPAAVLVLDGGYDPAWAQRVAAEFNLSETAFLRPADDPGAHYELRWFTPVTEVSLCGHATLAAAHVLFEEGAKRVADPAGPIRFRTLHSGVLTVRRRDGLLWMDFPAHPPVATDVPEGLERVLGAPPVRTALGGTGDLLVEVAGESVLRGLTPDIPGLGAFAERGVIVTAAATAGATHAFASRFFAPNAGVPEDPVTGSAHTVLAPYWAERLGRRAFEAVQCSARTGRLWLDLPTDPPGRVRIGGAAVTVTRGELLA